MTRSLAYPAVNSEQANARARADAEEHGWSVVESHWYPRLLGGGGVLVVQVSETQASPADPEHPGSPGARRPH
jgi:hypothetical protein